MRTALAIAATLSLTALVACGEDDPAEPAAETTTTASAVGSCTAIEEVEVPEVGEHSEGEFTAADYETNPPAGGDHNPDPLAAGSFYTEPPPLGETVHLLEHGGVVGWTNGLPRADRRAVEEAFNEVFQDGYYQLATVENPEMEVPFALSAWGAVQTCDEVELKAIRPFIEQWYASPRSAESLLACEGDARRLPPC